MSDLATFQVGDYIILKKRIGRGAFSTIYKGYNKYTRKTVAVKEISLETVNKYEKSLKRETEIMKKLNHPNIVKLYETIIDEDSENVYLIMEYFARGDFYKFLNKRPLKEKYALKYLRQIADGMEYLLNNKIVHRDMKPQNILMTQTGTIKITDFGFARYFDNDLLIQTICGSPLYMAPEIMKDKKYNYKSDLWSIGIIFYQMLMGEVPYKVKNIYELIRKIENDIIEIPQKFVISDKCKHLLFSLLEKDPNKRISWEAFFNHELIKKSDPFEEENKLMEISTLDSFPSIHTSTFNDKFNRKYSDIKKERISGESNLITSNENSLFYNSPNYKYYGRDDKCNKYDDNCHKYDDKCYKYDDKNSKKDNNKLEEPDKDIDLSLNFNFHLESSQSTNHSDFSENVNPYNTGEYDEVFFDSYETPRDMFQSSLINEDDFVKIKLEDDYFKSSLSLKNDLISNRVYKDFVIIKKIETQPRRRISLSKSFMGVMNNSVTFLKESYKYLSNYNSI